MTRIVWRGADPVRELPREDADLGGVLVINTEQEPVTLAEFLQSSWADACIVLHEGSLVYEWYNHHDSEYRPHGLLSITKSVVGTVAGVLIEEGYLDPDNLATDYVPELATGGYAAVTVRDLLDMRTGGDYRENGDAHGELARMEASRVGAPDAPFANLYDMAARIDRVGRHEGPLSYRSLDTTALGWVLERASGSSMTDLMSEKVLAKLGLERDGQMETDIAGHAAHAGGLSLIPRDVARFGQMILDAGAAGEKRVISPYFVKDLREGHPGETIDEEVLEEDGSYRNQFWVPQRGGRELLCLGVYGQMMVMDAGTNTTALVLSSWPQPRDTVLTSHLYAALRECSHAFG